MSLKQLLSMAGSQANISRSDLRKSAISVLIFGSLLAITVYTISQMYVRPFENTPYPQWVYVVNVTEHYIGVFAIASAFILQFGSRINEHWSIPYLPASVPPWWIPSVLFLVGSVFSIFSLRLFVPQPGSYLFTEFANLLLLAILAPAVVIIMARYSPPKSD